MLIDALSRVLVKSDALEEVWAKLGAGQDAALGVAASARPFITAAVYAANPRTMFVVVPGSEGAEAYARTLSAYLGEERVALFPARKDFPFAPKKADLRDIGMRAKAAWSLQDGRPVVVVASASALVRMLPPADARTFAPVVCRAQAEAVDAATGEVLSFEDMQNALVARGYENTGELDGPGTFCIRGGIIDVFPGTGVYPVRLDYFGDEIDEIRRVVPSTGQSISSLDKFEIFPVREYALSKTTLNRAMKPLGKRAETDPVWRDLYDKASTGNDFEGADALLPLLYDKTQTLGAYVRKGALTVLDEPRSLIDDANHAFEDASQRSQGSHISVDGLYVSGSDLDFGRNERLTLASIMRVGGMMDAELPVKRTDVAGDAERLVGRLRGFVNQDYTTVFSVPDFRARQDMKLLLVDAGIPIVEVLDVTGQTPEKLKRGVVNIVDVDVPLGMVIPKAKLAIVSVHDLQGRASSVSRRRHIDITEITFPYKPGDYVVHAAHGIAYFRGLVKQDLGGVTRDYLQLEYAEGDKLFVPVEQLDRVTRYVGPEGNDPRLTRLNTSDWSRALTKARKATKKLAFDLVDVYARRASVQGFRYSPDTPWQKEMEESFPYQETPSSWRPSPRSRPTCSRRSRWTA
ncbi:Transcription-repair-coupling factor [Slackia heliotrinireducens]|uniref:CarD family transcriptional regulator n=1 Tax=Slackia heliotrinireducens TaxID=84110 RepID=UPI0001A3740C|nr:CarD family transcriptional regulator [Slackia heliotrinireducens]VEH00612.1 Transcription-repair-coupling factor [Slackia heliotrinireducens]